MAIPKSATEQLRLHGDKILKAVNDYDAAFNRLFPVHKRVEFAMRHDGKWTRFHGTVSPHQYPTADNIGGITLNTTDENIPTDCRTMSNCNCCTADRIRIRLDAIVWAEQEFDTLAERLEACNARADAFLAESAAVLKQVTKEE